MQKSQDPLCLDLGFVFVGLFWHLHNSLFALNRCGYGLDSAVLQTRTHTSGIDFG